MFSSLALIYFLSPSCRNWSSSRVGPAHRRSRALHVADRLRAGRLFPGRRSVGFPRVLLLRPQRCAACTAAGQRPRGIAVSRLVAAFPRQAQRTVGHAVQGGRGPRVGWPSSSKSDCRVSSLLQEDKPDVSKLYSSFIPNGRSEPHVRSNGLVAADGELRLSQVSRRA